MKLDLEGRLSIRYIYERVPSAKCGYPNVCYDEFCDFRGVPALLWERVEDKLIYVYHLSKLGLSKILEQYGEFEPVVGESNKELVELNSAIESYIKHCLGENDGYLNVYRDQESGELNIRTCSSKNKDANKSYANLDEFIKTAVDYAKAPIHE